MVFIFILFGLVFFVMFFLFLLAFLGDKSSLVSFGFRSKHLVFLMNLTMFLRFIVIYFSENSWSGVCMNLPYIRNLIVENAGHSHSMWVAVSTSAVSLSIWVFDTVQYSQYGWYEYPCGNVVVICVMAITYCTIVRDWGATWLPGLSHLLYFTLFYICLF